MICSVCQTEQPVYLERKSRKCRECYLAQSRAWHRKNRESANRRLRENRLKREFGLTTAQYDELLFKQGGVCAVCRKPETVMRYGRIKRLAVDHCHTSGEVRGLLCQRCNILIGQAKDRPEVLDNAREYLCASR